MRHWVICTLIFAAIIAGILACLPDALDATAICLGLK
jgi:hypothetical protein